MDPSCHASSHLSPPPAARAATRNPAAQAGLRDRGRDGVAGGPPWLSGQAAVVAAEAVVATMAV